MMTGGGHEMAVGYVRAAFNNFTHHPVQKISNIFDKLPHPFSHWSVPKNTKTQYMSFYRKDMSF